ncbi:MAG: HDOD domain-containing protein [Rubrivivax sp.]|nr:HDOD domain-containing protein [Rubrivivax sp.]
MPSQAAATSTANAAAPSRAVASRQFGRYQLLRLLGKSERSMAWLVNDPQVGRDEVLMLPRMQPHGAAAVQQWLQRVRKASRLDHPHLAPPVELGVHEGWPFVVYELGDSATLLDRIGSKGLAAQEAASLTAQMLQALAFAHDAGLAHRDVQAFAVLVSDKGQVRVMGCELSCLHPASIEVAGYDPSLRAQQQASEADVLHLGVLMHHILTGQPALDETDTAKVAQRLPPLGREIVRLPFNTPRPVPEALRVIINRATDRQERQRYRSARTLGRALEGWLQVDSGNQGGPLALLLDRMRIVGVLPASPGAAERAARLAMMDKNRTDELAAVLLDDIALAFELLRAVNTAQLRGGQVSGNGPVLTVRRAIAMLGLDGVRRVALALREWPGPLADGAAAELQRAMGRARRAGRAAVALRPPGYDGEVVYLVALLQNLGRLVVQYHLPDEALQIGRLMQSASNEQGQGEEPGMSEEAAAMAVLGVDLEAIASAVARWWGFDDSVLHMMRRHSTAAGVRLPESDHESLRISASCANEAIDALALPAARVAHALQSVAQRYARVLNLSLRDLQAALQPGLQSEPWPGAGTQRLAAAPMPTDDAIDPARASA